MEVGELYVVHYTTGVRFCLNLEIVSLDPVGCCAPVYEEYNHKKHFFFETYRLLEELPIILMKKKI